MPKVGYCNYCKKAYMFSTYQFIEHYDKNHKKMSKVDETVTKTNVTDIKKIFKKNIKNNQ
jgi:hypothetical protein